MIKADFHVHTKFSCDSEAEMFDYLQKAKADNLAWICFTDHVDFNKNDYGFGYYSPEQFFSEFERIKEGQDTIHMCAGIEFSEPHLYDGELSKLKQYPYDFIIGSVHWIGDMFPCQEVRKQYSAKEFYTLYWNEVLRTVRAGGFDCLGHIDFPKRYYGEIYYKEEIINEIFKTLLEKEMILEINTSSLRKGLTTTMPDSEILQIYKNNGGQFVTIGSDAHEVKDVGADYETAQKVVEQLGLKIVVYKKRQRILL